jgi:hypothetical protein
MILLRSAPELNIAKEMDRYDPAAAPGKSYAPNQMKLKAGWQA